MEPSLLAKISILAALIVASGFFSSSEAALFTLGIYRVRRLKKSAQRSYLAAQKLLSEPTKLISTILAGNELVNVGIGVIGSSLVYQYFLGRVDHEFLPLLAVGLVLPFVIIFGEVIPKTIGIKRPESIATFNSVPLLLFSRLVAPFRDGITWITQKFLAWMGATPGEEHKVSEEVFRSMVDAGTEEGVVDRLEQRMIHNVFNLDDRRVEQIMTPVERVSSLRVGMSVRDALQRIETEKYSRYPVLDPDEKTVRGVLYAKDLLGLGGGQSAEVIDSHLRPAILVSAETSALHLFARFRTQRAHFAIVCGAFAHELRGVVTLDDVLREIFGTLRDERDLEEGATSKH